jgi:hypothetical protein
MTLFGSSLHSFCKQSKPFLNRSYSFSGYSRVIFLVPVTVFESVFHISESFGLPFQNTVNKHVYKHTVYRPSPLQNGTSGGYDHMMNQRSSDVSVMHRECSLF